MAEDVTSPDYLVRPTYGFRRVRTLSGKGVQYPGYRIRGEDPSDLAEGIKRVKVYKVVSPLTGQGPADTMATGRYFGMTTDVLSVNRLRVQKSVAPSRFGTGKVVRPPRTAVRRLDSRGTGTVSYA